MIKIYQDLLLKKRIEIYDQSGKNYNVSKEIRIKTPILKSDLCDFSVYTDSLTFKVTDLMQNVMSLLLLYQQRTIQNYQNY